MRAPRLHLRLCIGFAFLCVFCPSARAQSDKIPVFYFFNEIRFPNLPDPGVIFCGDKRQTNQLVESLNPDASRKYNGPITRETVKTSELKPKINEKLFIFNNSKLIGVAKPIAWKVYYNDATGEYNFSFSYESIKNMDGVKDSDGDRHKSLAVSVEQSDELTESFYGIKPDSSEARRILMETLSKLQPSPSAEDVRSQLSEFYTMSACLITNHSKTRIIVMSYNSRKIVFLGFQNVTEKLEDEYFDQVISVHGRDYLITVCGTAGSLIQKAYLLKDDERKLVAQGIHSYD